MKKLSHMLFEQVFSEEQGIFEGGAATDSDDAASGRGDAASTTSFQMLSDLELEEEDDAPSLMRLPWDSIKRTFSRKMSEETTASTTCSSEAPSPFSSPAVSLGASVAAWPKVQESECTIGEEIPCTFSFGYKDAYPASEFIAIGYDGVGHHVPPDFGDAAARGLAIAVARDGCAEFVPPGFGQVEIGACRVTSLILVSPGGTAYYRPFGDVPTESELAELEAGEPKPEDKDKGASAVIVQNSAKLVVPTAGGPRSFAPCAEDDESDGWEADLTYSFGCRRRRGAAGSLPRTPSLKRLATNLFLGRRLRM
jgi:hypothetical protein